MARAHDVAKLVQLNGGQIVGKTRLQKSAYFLETKGVGFDFDFSYYRFGPYSEELASSTDDAHALKLVDVFWKTSQGGTEYAIFCSKTATPEDEQDLYRRKILGVLNIYSAIEVELAATADFLKKNGYSDDPWAETKRRKASKVDEDRLARSKQLLRELEAI